MCQAAAYMRLTRKSNGIKSAILERCHKSLRRMPFPQAAISPVGPLTLSTQPATGSFHVAVTVGKNPEDLIYIYRATT